LSLTAKGGLNMFYGDLVDKSTIGFSFGLDLDKEIHKYFTVRTNLTFGKMQGTQLYGTDKSLTFANFKNTYFEWTIGGTYNILNQIYGYFRERTVQPYLLLQLGLIYSNATEYWGLDEYIAANKGDNVWRKVSGIAPVTGFGGGALFWINPRWQVNLEFYGTYAFSDKLDGHDYWYMLDNDLTTFKTNEKHKTKSNGFYYTATIGATYLFGISDFKNDFSYNRKSYEKNRKILPKKTRNGTVRKTRRR
jgi:hypothetical protein